MPNVMRPGTGVRQKTGSQRGYGQVQIELHELVAAGIGFFFELQFDGFGLPAA